MLVKGIKKVRNYLLVFSVSWMLVFSGLTLLIEQSENVMAAGPTEVSGIISIDTVWIQANSPYIVTGNILVENNTSLTIQPGVTVKFDGYYYIMIKGALNATGSETNMITFTSNQPTPTQGDWDRIKFDDTSIEDKCIIKYCELKYGSYAIMCIDVSPTITQNQFSYNNQAIHLVSSSSVIAHNYFSNNSNCIRVRFLSPKIKHNQFHNNGDAIEVAEYSNSVEIHNNSILNNNRGIIVQDGSPTITNNTIAFNSGCGLYIYGTLLTFQVRYNTIAHNGIGIEMDYREGPNFEYNNINHNINYNFYNGITVCDNITAYNNWWGGTDADLINQSIYDYYDDFYCGKVYFVPFLTSRVNIPDPNKPPIADAGPDQNTTVAQTVYFNGDGSYDPNGVPLTYNWDFGDGTSTGWQNNCSTSHTYNAVGNYSVILNVSDGKLTDEDTCIVFVKTPAVNNTPPVADAGPDQNATVGQTVYFNGVGSYDPDGDPLTHNWDFGDGTSTGWQNNSNASHSYSTAGNYTVTLTIFDGFLTNNDTCIAYITGGGGSTSPAPPPPLDSDSDGYNDTVDEFPNDPTQWKDNDEDGYGDNLSGNRPDLFPNDPIEWADTDGDGVGDNSDAYPNDPNKWTIGPEDKDSDGDGHPDSTDAFPNDATEWLDSDGDSVGNNADAYPNNPNKYLPDKVEDDGEFDAFTFIFIIMIIIIIIILILTLIIFRKKGRSPEDPDELVHKLTSEALTFKKPSDFGLSEQEMLNRIETKYRNGQISNETYAMIKEKLGNSNR